MKITKLWGTCLVLLLVGVLPGWGQKIEEVAFFKDAVGKWRGEGRSVVGPGKTELKVVDEWEGRWLKTAAGQAIFLQQGYISLSNGSSFKYRWRFSFEDGVLTAKYIDSNKTRSVSLGKLGDEGKSLSVIPMGPGKEPLKNGLFSTATSADGKFTYEAEIRDAAGQATVQTKVVCQRVAPAEPAKPAVEKK